MTGRGTSGGERTSRIMSSYHFFPMGIDKGKEGDKTRVQSGLIGSGRPRRQGEGVNHSKGGNRV